MSQPDLVSEFEYKGKVIVEWFDVSEKDKIPDFDWQQVYIIGNFDGKVPIVMYDNKGDNLPGGKTEPGESLNETILREIEEELNMKVTSWEPLGYQKLTRPLDNTPTYQFRAYAELEKINEFTNDSGGSVIGHRLVELDNLNKFIKYGEVGNRIVESCRHFFN
ncbi:MAG: NUDIX domain-containing protein [Candidatus Saccharibacteria bacterium]